VGALTNVATWTNIHNRQITPEEQELYDHLLYLANFESPSQLIERFRCLFVDATGYPDGRISSALERIATSKFADQEFRFILNRCCHILINRWQTRSQYHVAIPELIALFDILPSKPITDLSRLRSARRRLQDLVIAFAQSEQCNTLRRLAQVMQAADMHSGVDNRPLGTLIRRYPYLYEHCLITQESTFEHQQAIRQIQAEVQHQFEVDLSRYITYQVRRSQLARTAASNGVPERLIQPVRNPTLLNNQELFTALKQFKGKAEGNCTYRDLAQRFVSHQDVNSSYKTFKSDLYFYITASVDPAYGKQQFNKQLDTRLRNFLPNSDDQPLDDSLMIRTCSHLLNFLVVENAQNPHHFIFIDLVTNIGPTLTTGILLKIVLICRKVKPYLEKRFSILFNHYESSTRDAVQWLIHSLENLNVAMSANFGAVDLSYLQQIHPVGAKR